MMFDGNHTNRTIVPQSFVFIYFYFSRPGINHFCFHSLIDSTPRTLTPAIRLQSSFPFPRWHSYSESDTFGGCYILSCLLISVPAKQQRDDNILFSIDIWRFTYAFNVRMWSPGVCGRTNGGEEQ